MRDVFSSFLGRFLPNSPASRARRRKEPPPLRLESLESRDVPSALTADEVALPDATVSDSQQAAETLTETQQGTLEGPAVVTDADGSDPDTQQDPFEVSDSWYIYDDATDPGAPPTDDPGADGGGDPGLEPYAGDGQPKGQPPAPQPQTIKLTTVGTSGFGIDKEPKVGDKVEVELGLSRPSQTLREALKKKIDEMVGSDKDAKVVITMKVTQVPKDGLPAGEAAEIYVQVTGISVKFSKSMGGISGEGVAFKDGPKVYIPVIITK